jgi:hypothetical protein
MLDPYMRSFSSSGRVSNKYRNSGDPADADADSQTYNHAEGESFAGPFDTHEEALLKVMNFKDWTVRPVQLDNGIEALETGGRITSYIDPNKGGRLKDRLVDKRLVDEYGVWDINDLTDGQLSDYMGEHDNSGP